LFPCAHARGCLGRPHNDKNAKGGDPYRTIFVSRLSYQTDEERLTRFFDYYGQVKHVHIVRDTKTGKSRGYGFLEFADERAAEEAVRRGDRRIEGRLVLVDREFGRTEHKWLPRRLGGGKGDSRRDKADEEKIRRI
jgi:U1 small nuclear ribonucleoprotein 70kDa